MVRGTLTGTAAAETAVIVNGVFAEVYNSEFAANHVPLKEGQGSVTAGAVNTAGEKSKVSAAVNTVIPEKYILLVPEHSSGVSPFETSLEIGGTLNVSDSELSYTGTGTVEISGTGTGKYNVRITGSGFFYFTADASDSSGNRFSDTAAVLVYDPAEFDAMLKEKWQGMKNMLSAGDIGGAVNYFFLPSREKYTQIFTAIGRRSSRVCIRNGRD